jgi:hypothetical protein
MIPDMGLQVTGRCTDASENISVFIDVGDSVAGRKFKEMVIRAVQAAKK